MTQQTVRVRFAPSPTGPFHIGGARSALFNWLLAKKYCGKLILRIEDTDLERSTKESEENIIASLKWLGINWDEGVDIGGPYAPYRQSERLALYRKYAHKLLADGKAYWCYCTTEELKNQKGKLFSRKENLRYSGRCSSLTEKEKYEFILEGRKPVIRFKVPLNQEIILDDIVRGKIIFNSNDIGDFIIVKSNGIPVYNFAVVIDDSTMNITHIVRAEEHLSNTPRQLLIYEALMLPKPLFAHISLILGKDHSKMSKRHGATAIEEYKKMGYLPEAIVNFLVLLGWSPNSEQEIFSLNELIDQFSLERVAKNPAIFDIDKLNWINSFYIKNINSESFLELTLPYLLAAGYIDNIFITENREWLVKIVTMVQKYISYAAQIINHVDLFFNDDFIFDDEAYKILQDIDASIALSVFKKKLLALQIFNVTNIKDILKNISKELKIGNKKVFMPIRIAITGKMHGPDLDHIILILGIKKTILRINNCLKNIKNIS